ncbi:MAG: hypothetical protein VKL39_20570, partial [Leptolyngbyaceae bacterium]|nr:hypothetical protein [Leptolyngbyaceae bacterium]
MSWRDSHWKEIKRLKRLCLFVCGLLLSMAIACSQDTAQLSSSENTTNQPTTELEVSQQEA